MANRQYIGARYVPKFYEGSNGNNWDSGVAYEPLTVVTYLNDSYTSKKPVPNTIGNPAQNKEYWAHTGAYNAQVEEYRETVDELVEDYDNFKETCVITPEMYGAKGDGVTDDTEALKTMFEENPYATIIFKQGVYVVSDTIPIYGRTGGQYILLGGAIIFVSSAIEGSVFETTLVDGDGEAENMFGGVTIVGGVIRCNDHAYVGIKTTTVNTVIDGVSVHNPLHVGIQVGTSGYDYSTQCQIVHCDISNEATDHGNTGGELNRIGIEIFDSDAHVDSTDITRFKIGVRVHGADNQFNDVHITGGYGADYDSSVYGVVPQYGIDLDNDEGIPNPNLRMTKVYFDNLHYATSALNTPAVPTAVFNFFECQFLRTRLYDTSNGDMCYIVEPNCHALCNVYHMTIVKFGKVHIMPPFFRKYNVNNLSLDCAYDVTFNTTHGGANAYPFEFNNLVANKNKAIFVTNQTLNQNQYREIGCIALCAPVVNTLDPVDVTFNNRSFGQVKFQFGWNEPSLHAEIRNLEILKAQLSHPHRLIIKKDYDEITIDGIKIRYWKMLFGSPEEAIGTTNEWSIKGDIEGVGNLFLYNTYRNVNVDIADITNDYFVICMDEDKCITDY